MQITKNDNQQKASIMNNATNTFAPAIVTPAGGLPNLLKFIQKMIETRRQRIALGRLDAAHLADIGVSALDAQNEVNRPVWNLPNA